MDSAEAGEVGLGLRLAQPLEHGLDLGGSPNSATRPPPPPVVDTREFPGVTLTRAEIPA